jgi:hypothetical protein
LVVAKRVFLMNTKRSVVALVLGSMGSTANAVTFDFTGTNISGPTMLLLIGLGFIGFAALAFAWRRRH